MRTTCIIPYYNEAHRLSTVLDQIIRVSVIDEIVCVDDGSDIDHTSDMRQRYPMVTFVRHTENLGKTKAVESGLERAQGKTIVLIDADLQHCIAEEIEHAIQLFHSHNMLDMLILRRVNDWLTVRLTRGDVLFTGERIMKRDDLKKIYNKPIQRWQLETAINTYMMNEHKKVNWIAFSGINTVKVLKTGLWRAMLDECRTIADITLGAGIGNYFKQVLFFARSELRDTDK